MGALTCAMVGHCAGGSSGAQMGFLAGTVSECIHMFFNEKVLKGCFEMKGALPNITLSGNGRDSLQEWCVVRVEERGCAFFRQPASIGLAVVKCVLTPFGTWRGGTFWLEHRFLVFELQPK